MVICPNCNSNNLPNTKYCSNCGSVLPSPSSTSPNQASLSSEKPAPPSPPPLMTFIPRNPTEIIGNRYQVNQVTYADDQEARYIVSEYNAPKDHQIRVCSNPACGAVHSPWEGIEKFCTQCGAPLKEQSILLIMSEAASAGIYGSSREIIQHNLVHGSIRSPVDYIEDIHNKEKRYCLVVPFIDPIPDRLEPAQIMQSGVDLSQGLDYMHARQLSFGGMIDENSFAWAENHLVWGNFSDIILESNPDEQSLQKDIQALARTIFKLLTGKNQYNYALNLSLQVNDVFKHALTSPGFASGDEFAQALTQALTAPLTAVQVDFRVGRATHVGSVRTLNEDSILAIDSASFQQGQVRPLGVYAVADGMGGHSAGEVASGTVINALAQKAFSDLFAPGTQGQEKDCMQWLKEAIEFANRSVYELRKSMGTDMGSTLVLAVVEGQNIYVGHAGDSRAYQINTAGIDRLTADHSLVERLVATGQITREQVRSHPQRNVIYRTMGDKSNIEVDRSTHHFPPGEYLLLCSDGLWEMVDESLARKIILESNSPQEACDRLIVAANQAGGEDNISVIIVEIVLA